MGELNDRFHEICHLEQVECAEEHRKNYHQLRKRIWGKIRDRIHAVGTNTLNELRFRATEGLFDFIKQWMTSEGICGITLVVT